MPPQVTTFLMFNDGGARAIELYRSVFRDADVREFEVEPSTGQLLRAAFTVGGHEFLAMDAGGGFSFAEGMSLFIDCEDQGDVDYYWERLSANGGETGRCGWLKDPFGISWQVVPHQLGELLQDPDRERAGRVLQAMLQMTKLDVGALQAAYDGAVA
jgi:predicted 3-demethylubiquinone-9 3-methyltransferase (glyoxalase superfamily)